MTEREFLFAAVDATILLMISNRIRFGYSYTIQYMLFGLMRNCAQLERLNMLKAFASIHHNIVDFRQWDMLNDFEIFSSFFGIVIDMDDLLPVLTDVVSPGSATKLTH